MTIIGAEEAHLMMFPSGRIAKMLGLPFVPVTPTFPLLGPLGLAGLPARWKIFFGEPIPMDVHLPDGVRREFHRARGRARWGLGRTRTR